MASSRAFAVWFTGLPASGKSTLVAALKAQLSERGIDVAVLESDALRTIFTPHPTYDQAERDTFYAQLVYVGSLLTQHGVPVIFDATANRRTYRDRARAQIPNFLEVFVQTPLETCVARDPKGIYSQGQQVPGLQADYEPPSNPELTVRGDQEAPRDTAQRVLALLIERGFVDHTQRDHA